MTDLAKMIENAGSTAVFTGAGVSTLCGIPDFRGPQGIYRHLDADRIFGLEQFRADPSFYYRHAKDFIYTFQDRRPGVVHDVCADLEKRGLLQGVITQNIDMLHQRAGSRNVIELHGSPATHSCLRCGWQTAFDQVAPVVQNGNLPTCDACGGVVKPDVTFFGEMLPDGALEEAFALAMSVDLLLVLGSSLVVQPTASPRWPRWRPAGVWPSSILTPPPWTAELPAAGKTWRPNSRPWPVISLRIPKNNPLQLHSGLIFDESPGNRCQWGPRWGFQGDPPRVVPGEVAKLPFLGEKFTGRARSEQVGSGSGSGT